MRVLIIGASKGIGLETTRQALQAGHDVRALARSATAIAVADTSLEKMRGDALKTEDVEAAVVGVDAVIQTLGVGLGDLFRPVHLFSDATRVQIAAMRSQVVKRLICVTGFGAGAIPPEGITQERAMKRFHVRASDGRVLSGAAAFVEVWTRLPRWRWAARAASLPGALIALGWGYRLFLPFRPFISRFFGRVLRLHTVIGGAKRL
jgi:uncharacterized protein YbjT (DUF2867 family)